MTEVSRARLADPAWWRAPARPAALLALVAAAFAGTALAGVPLPGLTWWLLFGAIAGYAVSGSV